MTEPIFLQGICKDYLWGGNRLREEYGKKSDADQDRRKLGACLP